MRLLNRFFGRRDAGDTQPQSSQFHETESTVQQSDSTSAARRELLKVVLRDTIRRQGTPADWIDCRILSVVTRRRRAGMHVQFIVKKGQMQLLSSVHDFQRGFWQGVEHFDPRARDWLLSVAWQFDGPDGAQPPAPAPSATGEMDTEPPTGDTQPMDANEELQADLRALYAIRDAALADGGEPTAAAAAPARRGEPGGS